MSKKQTLRWRFDVNTFRLLGRELITDRVTAIFELVKNCYDANAKEVYIDFINVGVEEKATSQIVIKDDGQGMSLDDISDKWMVVGTNSKRTNRYSGPPFNRRVVGEKGVGRFAVEKLGSELLMQSKQSNSSISINVEINWNIYENLSNQYDLFGNQVVVKKVKSSKRPSVKKYFTDVDNKYWNTVVNDDSQGTTLTIRHLRETWSLHDIQRVKKELSKLITPIEGQLTNFAIFIKAPAFAEFQSFVPIINRSLSNFTTKYELNYDIEDNKQQVLRFKKDTLSVAQVPIQSMGPVKMVVYYLDSEAKKKFKALYTGENADGLKVYRNGVIATPFAEYEAEEDKKRDILGIDKRKHNAFFDRLGSRDIVGFIEITKELNPNIIDSTNRQDFVDNQAYREFKEFIIEQIYEIEKFVVSQREIQKVKAETNLAEAKAELIVFTQTVQQTIADTPHLESKLKPLLQVAKKVQFDFNKGIKAYNELEKDKVRQETIFMSLMSLQEYATQIAHVVRTSLGRVIQYAEFVKNFYPTEKFNEEYSPIFEEYASKIFTEMLALDRAIDYMLSYALASTDDVDVNIKSVIEELLYDVYKSKFTAEHIAVEVDIAGDIIIRSNKRVALDIFENLISNSIKSLRDSVNKIIKCTGYVDGGNFVIYFSDNGIGIPKHLWERIFNIYYTTTAEEGGAGIGLFVVKSRVESMKGSIEVVDPEFVNGATFRIQIPLNNVI